MLGFDDDAGIIGLVDAKLRPTRIDLRRDSIDTALREPLTAALSLDGTAIYGVSAKGAVVRSTPSDARTTAPGEWRFSGSGPARGALPLRDGSVLVWTERQSKTVLTRLRPPSKTPIG